MLFPRVIPILLLSDNGLVKTKQFGESTYVGDPLNAVKIFNDKEVDEIVFLDIQATKNRIPPNYEMIEKIASECFMPLAYGGGITNIKQIDKILEIGVEKIVINSCVISNPKIINQIAKIIGSQSVVVSIDIKKNFFGNYSIFSHSENKLISSNIIDYIKKVEELGAGEIIINSVDKDGMMNGFDIKLLNLVKENVMIPFVACGGAGNVDDLKEGIDIGGAHAVSAGSMFVFHGKHNAVLINYLDDSQLKYIYSGNS